MNLLYLCGTAEGPKDITYSVLQADAAALEALSLVGQDYVSVEPLSAFVKDSCNGCGMCCTAVQEQCHKDG